MGEAGNRTPCPFFVGLGGPKCGRCDRQTAAYHGGPGQRVPGATLNFKIDLPPQVTDFPRLHALANRHELTAYDVAYLDLATRLTLPLATRDADLKKAALAEGIEVLRQ